MTSKLLRRLVLGAALLCGMHAASAQMQPLSEDELSAMQRARPGHDDQHQPERL
jgi:hypothetical protein